MPSAGRFGLSRQDGADVPLHVAGRHRGSPPLTAALAQPGHPAQPASRWTPLARANPDHAAEQKRRAARERPPYINSGNDLLSRTVARAVPSALGGLTSEFGMGSGVSPPLWSPEFYNQKSRLTSLSSILLMHPREHRVQEKLMVKSHDQLVPLD